MKIIDQIKSIKFDWNKLKGVKGDTRRGYVGLKFETLDFDKQKHALGAIVIALPVFGFLLESEFTKISETIWRTDLFTALVSSLILWLIGWMIEYGQKVFSNKKIQPYDAHIMLITSLTLTLSLCVWRVIRFYVL